MMLFLEYPFRYLFKFLLHKWFHKLICWMFQARREFGYFDVIKQNAIIYVNWHAWSLTSKCFLLGTHRPLKMEMRALIQIAMSGKEKMVLQARNETCTALDKMPKRSLWQGIFWRHSRIEGIRYAVYFPSWKLHWPICLQRSESAVSYPHSAAFSGSCVLYLMSWMSSNIYKEHEIAEMIVAWKLIRRRALAIWTYR